MNAVILIGTSQDQARTVAESLTANLRESGWTTRSYGLAEMAIPPCAGDFDCWLKTPGLCRIKGPHQEIAASAAQSDLLVYLTPVTWGGYSHDLKKLLDHLIPNITALMEVYQGETHHKPRYPSVPDLLAVGLLEKADADRETIFRGLVERNVLNFHFPKYDVRFVYSHMTEEVIADQMRSWLPLGRESRSMALPSFDRFLVPPVSLAPRPPKKAVFLVGSPNGWKGHSGVLATYVADKLRARGVDIQAYSAYAAFNSTAKTGDLATSVAGADLLFLTAPLYVDQLPAPVIRLLGSLGEMLAGRADRSTARFAALVNSGFPEPTHNEPALAIYRQFAIDNGFEWAGGVGFPGGGMYEGKSVEAMGGRARRVRAALDMTAEALGRGEPIPADAVALPRQLIIPKWLYRFIANVGFRWAGRGKRLGARPHE